MEVRDVVGPASDPEHPDGTEAARHVGPSGFGLTQSALRHAAVRNPDKLAQKLLTRAQRNGWTIEKGRPWTHLHPPVPSNRIQGWKLHVSASLECAPEVLKACSAILIPAQAHFKYASTVEDLLFLNSRQCPRPNSGKFITIYPEDDEQFYQLASLLHEVTEAFEGPKILSDEPYKLDSRVSCRYGAFAGINILSNDGTYINCIIDSLGRPVEDRRTAVFEPPSWISTSPFGTYSRSTASTEQLRTSSRTQDPDLVVLSGRYGISKAIRHSTKGGVYLGRNLATGHEIVIKEARPYVSEDYFGNSAIDLLNHEARVLRRIQSSHAAPMLIDHFVQENHTFIVLEQINGETFRQLATRAVSNGYDHHWQDQVLQLGERLAEALQLVHKDNVVIRDISPNNVIKQSDSSLRFIDFEIGAIRAEETATWEVCGPRAGTPGFSAPEQFRGVSPDFTADLFSLGSIIYYLATGNAPLFIPDEPEIRTFETRIAGHLEPPLAPSDIRPETVRICQGLLKINPLERMPLEEVLRIARSHPRAAASSISASSQSDEITPSLEPSKGSREHCEELIGGILAHLARNVGKQSKVLWPETLFGETAEQCTVQHGVAGTTAVLARLTQSHSLQMIQPLLNDLLTRVQRHLVLARHILPGLYFGFSGTAGHCSMLGQLWTVPS